MMQIIQNIFIIVVCCLALGQGASWLVDAAVRIARRLGISELVIGLTIVAFGSSAPEFAVSVSGALGGNPDISVGNIVGSNIFNIGFILGGIALFGAVKTRPALVWRDGILLVIVTVGLLGFLYDHQLARYEGVALFLLLLAYLAFLFYKRQPLDDDQEHNHRQATWKDGFFLLIGLALIVLGGHFLVSSAVQLAQLFGLSQWVIAMTVVAAGTSVPEFVISLVALIKKHHGISAGNLIGSNIFNTLGVLGVASSISPLSINPSALVSIIMLIPLTVMVVIFMRTGWRVSRLEGAILIIVAILIWSYTFTLGPA